MRFLTYFVLLPTLAQCYKTHIYWGQNKAATYTQDTTLYEPRLSTFCATPTKYDVITIGFVTLHSLSASYPVPGMVMPDHCTAVMPGYPKPSTWGSPAFLTCPQIQQDIAVCQANGIKVLLGISPTDTLASANAASTSANNIWNYFLGGSSSTRPFGSAILDGVDLYIRAGGTTNWDTFTITLRSLMNNSGSTYQIVASPLGATGNAYYGPEGASGLVLNTPAATCSLDMLNVFMMTFPTTYVHPDLFWQQLTYWQNWLNGLSCSLNFRLGLPSHNGWADDAPGDYIAPWTFQNVSLWPQVRNQYPSFTGVALYEGSLNVIDLPCANSNLYYSQWVQKSLALSAGTNDTVTCVQPVITVKNTTVYNAAACLSDVCVNSFSKIHGWAGIMASVLASFLL